MSSLKLGAEGKISRTVESQHSADVMGNPGAKVLATPILGLFFEHAATEILKSSLDSGQGTLGVRLVVNHLAATPVGMGVTITARLVDIEGRRLRFEIEACDDMEVIGTGEHERVIVDWAKFLAAVGDKEKRASPS